MFAASHPAHPHDFGQTGTRRAEQRARLVAWITLVTMLGEVVAGWLTGSMALLADGIHMAGHALALGLAAFSYALVRRYALDRRLSFGSGKIGDLAAYSSTLFLALSTVFLAGESLHRLLAPQPLHAREALAVTVLGLAVNLICAFLLHEGHGHEHSHVPAHDHGHAHDHAHAHAHAPDSNLRAAFLHVLADLVTSVAALLGLAAAWLWQWNWLDPLIALAACVLILRWSLTLMRQSAAVLLDRQEHGALAAQVQARLATLPNVTITDFHLWRVGQNAWTLIAALRCAGDKPPPTPDECRALLADIAGLHHPIIEVSPDADSAARAVNRSA